MGKTRKFVAAALAAVVVTGGAVVVGAQDPDPPVVVCVKAGADLQAPKAGGTCGKGYTSVTLARQSDVDALVAQLSQLSEQVASLEARVAALEHPAGTIGPSDVAVVSTDTVANTITTADSVFSYDDNDTFFLRGVDTSDAAENACSAGEEVTQAIFETYLSAGDELDGSTFFQPNPDLPSSFCVEDLTAPQGTPSGAGPIVDDQTLTSVDTGANTVTTASGTYAYDDNDTFFLRGVDTNDTTATPCTGGDQVTRAAFEASLSVGDELDESTFVQPNPDLPSSYCLENLT